jgi:hypothetical protein
LSNFHFEKLSFSSAVLHISNLTLCQLDISSTGHFVYLPFHELNIFVNLVFCQLVITSTCYFIPFLKSHLLSIAILTTCHFINLPLCQLAILQLAISTNCHYVNLPLCQLAISTTCHFINLTFHFIFTKKFLLVFTA